MVCGASDAGRLTTRCIAFSHQDYDRLSAAAKKFIAYIIHHVK